MKRILILTFLTLLLSFGLVSAADIIEIAQIANVPAATSPATVTALFSWENDQLLQGVSTGYKVTVTGPATAKWLSGSQAVYNDLVGAMGWQHNYNYADSTPSRYLFGGAYMPGVFDGVPVNSLREAHAVDAELTFTGDPMSDTAIVCVDSSYVPPAGDWVWDPGGGLPNMEPIFNGDSAECFYYSYVPCQNPAVVPPLPPGDALAFDHCVGGTFQFTGDPVEPGESITGWGETGDGDIDGTGLYTFPDGAPGTYAASVECYNGCPGTSDPYNFTVELTNAGQQYNNCPSITYTVSQGKTFCYDFGLVNLDCDPLTEGYNILGYTGPGTGIPVGTITVVDGELCFETDAADVGTWTFEIWSDDGWAKAMATSCPIDIEVLATSTFGIRIPKLGEPPDFVFQGHYVYVPIYLDYASVTDPIGGYDLLIGYDASALTFISATLGANNDCWEFFTYRNGPFGNCSGMCPTGMLRLVAMAESNNGPYHPSGCDAEDGFFTTPDAELAVIKFYVTDDRTYECQFVPIYFFWMDCGDNALSNWDGDILYISNNVYNINWVNPLDPYYELIPPTPWTENDHIYGAWEWCDDNPNPDKPTPIRDVDFFNGGVDIACADSIDLRGDLNLNNLANEIADAVLYTNYFIYGPSVFDINMPGQIAASDVNNDGRVLTVGDLVYLIRILTGDAFPFTKLSPFAHEATVSVKGDVVSLNSPVDFGAGLFVFTGEAEIENLTNMDMLADVVDGQTRVLLYNIGSNHIDAGVNELVRVNGDATLTEVELSDYNGNQLSSNMVAKIVPKAYALHQNYPNPFNPGTEIAFDLPEAANWTVNVYNVTGRLVKSYSGYSDAGVVKINVDADGWASGIYFYKAVANDFVATKKMVLMK